MKAAMQEKRKEAQAVRDCPDAPTFANTLEALERIGRRLSRVRVVYDLWDHNFATPELSPIRQALEPLLSKLHDDIYQDGTLYARVQAVAEQPLDEEQRRLVAYHLRNFERAGAHLDAAGRERIAAINQRLSVLYTTFSDNLLADEDGYVTWLEAHQLGGLSDAFLDAAKEAAQTRGKPDLWAIPNTRSSVEPFLQMSTERDLREAVWRTFYSRGDHYDAHDTKPLIVEIQALRIERAGLLGYPTHAHLRIAPAMAKEPERARALLEDVWKAAKRKFASELEALQALADADGITIDRWDVRYYAEIDRKANHDFDPSALAAHFQLSKLVEAMFWAATRMFGWTFTPIDVPVPHPDFRVWRVDQADGSPKGLFYFDPFARQGKRSGAWMTAYRVQDGLGGALPIVSNNCNFLKAPGGVPTTLSLDEAETLFHEFGHAMHGLASDVRYKSIAGTSVPRDFVEFPSQLNEHWLFTPELLERFALHRVTGAPPDRALIDRLETAANADSGFMTLEFLASAVIDLEMHLRDEPVDPAAFEDEILDAWGLPREVVMRHRTPQFSHVFSGEAYSAGYYSYLWADMLVADAAEHFHEHGFYDREQAGRLMDLLLSRGDSVDPAEAYRTFRGRDPNVDALLRDRGFDVLPG
ncbi:MAG: M3 family metallopeptidase [Alphaproteobacteria bacterium]|nr:M3 family metallopeptidase [Alphaproteobacteria bacterium]